MELTTERLILRELREEDWRDVLASQVDPFCLRYLEAVESFIQMFLEQQRGRARAKFQLPVTLRSNHHLIGTCGIHMKSADAREGDIGYELVPAYWRQGYATEAARAIVQFGFSELHLHRI